jgi:L-threonylcarbamoyladenylate synthase
VAPNEVSLSDDDLFMQIKNCIEHHGLIVYPTDSIYGLGADARDDHSVLRVFEAKRRPSDKPLSVVVSRDTLPIFAELDEHAINFIDRFLPGPITVILNQTGNLSDKLNLNEPTRIGFRILPRRFRISEFVDAYQIPLTATSANISASEEYKLQNILRDLPLTELDLVIHTKIQTSRIPSTILDLTVNPPRIVREGVLSAELRKIGCV